MLVRSLCLSIQAILVSVAPAPGAEATDLAAFARQVLGGLQAQSFAEGREFCGMIGRDGTGALVSTRPRKGGPATCTPRDFRDPNVRVVASYHTHGAWLDFAGEVPSPSDVASDVAAGIDGFLSTPGGRFWFIDGQTGQSHLVCGAGCLGQDPDYDAISVPPIQTTYDFQSLPGFQPVSANSTRTSSKIRLASEP